MTPDDVVARAKELVEGQEVLLTVRAQVNRSCPHSGELFVTLTNATAWDIPIVFDDGTPCRDLVDIRPAPLRIEPGELLRGDDHGGLQGFDGYIGADEITADSELVRVRVVEGMTATLEWPVDPSSFAQERSDREKRGDLPEDGDQAPVAPEATSLYRYFDRQGVLLYVGITARGIARNREHDGSRRWWRFVHRQEVEHFPTRADALDAERALIRAKQPPFNRQHNPDHEALSTAYLRYCEAITGKAGPGQIMQQNKGRLPLLVVGFDNERNILTLRSAPEHVRLASRIDVPDPLWAECQGMRAACTSATHDDFGLVLLLQGRWLREVTTIAAVVAPKAGRYRIRKFEVGGSS